ncbi:MAG: aconitate hydratase 1 [Chloroflexi bacterium GWB2_49_20]|nr:MAG: aconitate hydratase 1 [Chloroflexi bacterium GWB2_49_20]OGN79411.1 MAG: aconitate hydratase 1 [Chloroflexi bacterium GWC2_49_37]OGN82820.1 MAG: aconitate hydratase 1 [Chloroflexi bacterium GWD2_49_16]HCC79720.1 aconitate hydratase AcnA [Anaerolineae bacterium]HCM97292.1 aconitate hydratase AcnA [Anaerolineae bacterium]
MTEDFFKSRDVFNIKHGKYTIYRLDALEKAGLTTIQRLPYSIRVMLEAALRQCNDREITQEDVKTIAAWKPVDPNRPGIPFLPARVVMQDFTGVPAVVDLAAMRSAVARLGGDPKKVNPIVPVDLVIDHSVQVDFFATADSLQRNTEMEFQRNRERYEFLKWGQKAFDNFRVVPPATGIVHQVNLEYLAQVVLVKKDGKETLAYPDSLVGTDSHTTMINGLGVVGWGVGGIEAEAVMLGQPMDMLLPDVIGFKLHGRLKDGVTATDLVLTITQMLRTKGVVGKFVEFFGPGMGNLALTDRATIANMAPEYGATMGFFPVDKETLNYMRMTGRPEEMIKRTEAYCYVQDLFRDEHGSDPEYTDTIELDLGSVQACLAGPKRPQDRVNLPDMKKTFQQALIAPVKELGFELKPEDLKRKVKVGTNGGSYEIGHGAVVIAAITSCTNTSNPSVMIAAGLVAKKALERGLTVKPQVKTSLAPGSRVVTEYLEHAKLLEPLAKLGFNLVGYGCTTCIGNSGPLPGEVAKAIGSQDIVAAAVISGNRNFEGRVHPQVKANYLASPPLVVAYALAGTVDIDLDSEPLGIGKDGKPVYLKDIWPTTLEVLDLVITKVDARMFIRKYRDVFEGSDMWKDIEVTTGDLYSWNEASTYIQHPPFFHDLNLEVPHVGDIKGARVLALLRDSITTDHISPAGNIASNSPAGKYLQEQGVVIRDFNSYGSRRGNDRVMTRGTFANIRLKNQLVPGVEGGVTHYFGNPEEDTSIFDAAMQYAAQGVPSIVLAGKEYGTGSSRDWAAKGTLLLGVKAVIAESFERIHRSNLVGMGVLPMQFEVGQNTESLGLKGDEIFDITGLGDNMLPQSTVTVIARKANGQSIEFKAKLLLNTPVEVNYYRNGGILHTVLRNMVK